MGDHPVEATPPAKHAVDQFRGQRPVLSDEFAFPLKRPVKELLRERVGGQGTELNSALCPAPGTEVTVEMRIGSTGC